MIIYAILLKYIPTYTSLAHTHNSPLSLRKHHQFAHLQHCLVQLLRSVVDHEVVLLGNALLMLGHQPPKLIRVHPLLRVLRAEVEDNAPQHLGIVGAEAGNHQTIVELSTVKGLLVEVVQGFIVD